MLSIVRIGGALVCATFALCLATAPASAQGKLRVAVLAFENNTTLNIFGDRLGRAAADEVTTQLVKSDPLPGRWRMRVALRKRAR